MIDLKEYALELTNAIKEGAEIASMKEKCRCYLGMSEIGFPCKRKLQYSVTNRRKSKNDFKSVAAFAVGKAIEPVIIDWVRAAGFIVEDCQVELADKNGLFVGHPDGIIRKIVRDEHGLHDAILEVKTAKAESFNRLREGINQANEQYWFQGQCYMHYTGKKYCLFVVFNKNTSEIYCEIITYCGNVFAEISTKADEVIEAKDQLERFEGADPDCFPCSHCGHRNECWGIVTPWD